MMRCVGLAMVLLVAGCGEGQKQPTLLVYCAAGMRVAVEAAARQYRQEYGIEVQLQYGGSQTILANVEVSRRGDLYLPADEQYMALAADKGLIAETIPLASTRLAIAVRKGNPRGIGALPDLLRGDVRLAQASPDAAAAGKLTRDALMRTGQWDSLEARTLVFKPTVNDVANDVKLGTVDAAIVWTAFATQYPELAMIAVPELADARAHIAVAVLRDSANPTAALRFARYLGAPQRGGRHFAQAGYEPVAGDEWPTEPELKLMAGAMLRPAIEKTITEFEQREGVRVTRVYNGCGILTSQMRAGQRPDAYFACDTSFMDTVGDLYIDPQVIAGNRLVIVVPRANPRSIKTLADLAAPGLKLGLAHGKQSALGALTQRMLQAAGLYEGVRANVTVESPTGDFLVNQIRTGSLDAVIVYVSNAAASLDQLAVVAIDLPGADATQPVAVARASKYPQLAGRLIARIRSAESRKAFESVGFTWKAEEK